MYVKLFIDAGHIHSVFILNYPLGGKAKAAGCKAKAKYSGFKAKTEV